MNEITNRYVASVMPPESTVYQGWAPCIRWCEEHLGNYRGWWYLSEGVFEFKHERDLTLFLLKWA
jgi:hypothetical protein